MAGGAADALTPPPIRRLADDAARAPLSFAQERLWFIARLEQNDSLYSMPGALRLRGAVRPELLAASLREIVRRHATLRTRFVATAGQPVQVIDPAWRPPLPLIDLAGLAPAAAARESERLLAGRQGPPFDLAAGPLLQANLVRVAAGDFLLLVTMHHIVSDGWSIALMLAELTALYSALARGLPPALPELPVQYADFAAWQREWLRGAALDRQLAYWRGQLAGAPPLGLPADRQAAAGQTAFLAAAHAVTVPRPTAAALHTLAARQGASAFMALLASFQALLHRHTGHDDITVGAPVAGRNRPEIEPLIGFFVNTLALRTRLGAGLSFRQLLAEVRTVTLGALQHQDLPFSLLVEALRPDRRQGALPLVEAMFTLQNQPPPRGEVPGVELALVERAAGADLRTQFALVLNLRESGGELAGTLAWNTALFDRPTAARWRGHWLQLLTAAIADSERPLAELPMLSAAERHQLSHEGSDWSARGGAVEAAAAGTPPASGTPAPPGAPALRGVPDSVLQARSKLLDQRAQLSPVKRELLARRLSGALAASGSRPSAGAAPPAAAVPPAAALPPGTEPDLLAEAVLDPAIGPAAAPAGAADPARPGESGLHGAPARVLLTGATGFLGAFLLAELLQRTPANVVCLVRAGGDGEARARLRASLEDLGAWDEASAHRVEALPGDLGRPLLGLTRARFDALAAETAAIYHNGAWVNATYPYAALRAANVLGTQEVLRLAFQGRLKPVHFTSTLSVFFAPEYSRLPIVPEDDALEHPHGAISGYSQTKWVAEKLIAAARRRGLPAAVYRFGRATWHSRTGAWNRSDTLRHVIEICLRLHSVPDVDLALDLAPVDHVAAAIVALSLDSRSAGRAFHLLSPQEVSWRQLTGWLRALGHEISALPFEQWIELARTRSAPEELPHLLRLRGLATQEADPARPQDFTARFDRRNALAGLAGSGLVCPEIGAASLGLFLARCAGTAGAPVEDGRLQGHR
jgi:thioester reductase-like protein